MKTDKSKLEAQTEQLDIPASTYFTDAEIEKIKEGSLNLPYFLYDDSDPNNINPNNIIGAYALVAMVGMVNNNGTPTELRINNFVKGKETKSFIYRLVQ